MSDAESAFSLTMRLPLDKSPINYFRLVFAPLSEVIPLRGESDVRQFEKG